MCKVMEKKKVLMLASVASMIDQFNMPNIRLLQSMGYEVHTACNFKQGNTCSTQRIQKLKKELQQMAVHPHQWDCPRDLSSFRDCCRAYQQLLHIISKYPFAWIHCHSPVGGALARMAAHRKNIRIIYTVHGFHFYKGAPLRNWMLYYPAEKLLAYWTDILVTVNLEDYRFAERNLKAGRVFYIPGIGIDTEKFRTQWQGTKEERMLFYSKYKIPEHAVVLLSVGELSSRKNHRMVMNALSAMRRKDVYYLICGQGPLREELQRYARRLGVAGRIRMPGYQEDLSLVYQNADIFVFPSIQEGMPAALMEAMAAGLPCVVSDIRGNRELVTQAGGARFRMGHPEQSEQLERVLVRLIENEKLRNVCGAYNRKKIKAYALSAVQDRMKVIYAAMQP